MGGPLVAGGGEGVLVLAGYAVLLREVFSCHAHAATRAVVGEGFAQSIDEFIVAHPNAEAGLARDVGGLAHILCAARQADFRLTELYGLGCGDHGLKPRAAEPIQGQGWSLYRDTRIEGDVTGQVRSAFVGLYNVAITTLSTLLASIPERSNAPLATATPSSWAVASFRPPPKDPKAVRAPSTM